MMLNYAWSKETGQRRDFGNASLRRQRRLALLMFPVNTTYPQPQQAL